jgi:2'-5' RNA ligase
VYPCLPVADFPAAQERLAAACREIPAFEVELAEFHTFRHRRGNHTIWLAPKPESDLIGL